MAASKAHKMIILDCNLTAHAVEHVIRPSIIFTFVSLENNFLVDNLARILVFRTRRASQEFLVDFDGTVSKNELILCCWMTDSLVNLTGVGRPPLNINFCLDQELIYQA